MKSPIQNNLIIELHVPDFQPEKDFYSKLGFEIILENPKGKFSGYMVMRRNHLLGNTIINFYGDDERVYEQSYFKKFDRNTKLGYAVEITIPVHNIEIFYNKISKILKENIMQELIEKKDEKTSWHDFRLADPYGFYIRVTELIDWGQ